MKKCACARRGRERCRAVFYGAGEADAAPAIMGVAFFVKTGIMAFPCNLLQQTA